LKSPLNTVASDGLDLFKSKAKAEYAKSSAAIKFVAHFSASGKLDVIENWLKQYAKERWTISTEGMSNDLQTKKISRYFR